MLLRYSSPRDLVKKQILIEGPRFCIFSKLSSDANATGLWTTRVATAGWRWWCVLLWCAWPISPCSLHYSSCVNILEPICYLLVNKLWSVVKSHLLRKCHKNDLSNQILSPWASQIEELLQGGAAHVSSLKYLSGPGPQTQVLLMTEAI